MGYDPTVEFNAISPDGTCVVTLDSRRTARIWDAVTSEQRAVIKVPGSRGGIAFSPDSRRMVIWTERSEVVDFSPAGKPIDRPHEQTLKSFAVACVYDVATGTPVGQPMPHEERLNDVAFSPDGTRLVTSSDDGTSQVRDAVTGFPIGPPQRHGERVYQAKFSPDGKRIATVTQAAVHLWDAETGARIGAPLIHAV